MTSRARPSETHGKWLERFMAQLSNEQNTTLVLLAPPDQRKTVCKHENGDLEVREGPAVPGPEQVRGYCIVEAESIEDAVAWARKGRRLVGSNEVRQTFSPPAGNA